MSDFYRYFKENMDALGLPAPESLYGSFQTAVTNAGVLLGLLDKFGRKVTVRELIGAGTRLEKLVVVGALSGAFYVGAVIGSIAVATGRVLGNGTSLADVMLLAQQQHLSRPWLPVTLRRWPGTYKDVPGRNMYRLAATQR
ncbi:hypothetical protein [Pseudoduganella albidiflava]|uniref:Uncharacterized protein n=1 Tax=Pseudoduganella albidiflava TaxID=321983 RepID=A0A411WSM0_9BURK|nr:hypothetical protein [Pseudoduganella albidiflava]QBH99772.1 hypothetical protein EYF70_02140 [Pseudoduganella albidiflava]GGY62971.1 hypothetical protein GCM10007387_51810 [Pseudoduganella albidiflava]